VQKQQEQRGEATPSAALPYAFAKPKYERGDTKKVSPLLR